MNVNNNFQSYFSRNSKAKETQCLICGEKMKISQLDTTSLILHLNSAHPETISQSASQLDTNMDKLDKSYGNIYNLGNESNMGNSVDWGIGDSSFQNQSVINYGNKQNNIYNSFGDTFKPNYNFDNLSDDQSILIDENHIDISKSNIQKQQSKSKPKQSIKQQKIAKEKQRVQKSILSIQAQIQKIENTDTYSNYTGIKNRPQKFLQKIKSQGYLGEPYIPYLPTSSKQSKQSFEFKQFFKDIDLALNREYSISIAKNKLDISIEQAAKLVNDFWWGNKQMNQISSFFIQRGINFKESISKNVIMISQMTALNQYFRYGQCVYVVSYSQIVEKFQDKATQNYGSHKNIYDGYILMCSDWRSEMIVVGMALVKINNPFNILEMLEIFFGYMKGFITNTIVFNCLQDQNSKNFIKAVSQFCSIYSCQINTISNFLINTDKYFEKYQNIELVNQINNKLNQQIQNQVHELKKQIKAILNEKQNQQNFEEKEFIQEIKLKIIKKCEIIALSAYDHQDNKKIKTFFGLSVSQEQDQSLRRKLYTVKKPGQQTDKDFSEFISRIFRLIRNFKKICKDPDLDYRYQYRYYDHPIVYKLYRKLGYKIFNALQKNYLEASKLKIIVKGPLIAEVSEQESANNQFKKVKTYQLRYSLDRDHWICNCKKIYQTGIPCRHLIAIVLKYQGCISYYLNTRWMPTKGDRQKLKKLNQKKLK